VIHHERNRVYGGALQTGFRHATKDLVFYTDGDGQYDIDELAILLPLLTDDVDIVNGYKRKRADKADRIVLGGIYKLLARMLFKLPIRDVDCDFRLLRRSAIQSIDLYLESGCICTEMVYKLHRAGCRFIETPVHHYPRQHGRSQFFTLHRVARTATDFFALWWKLVASPSLSPQRCASDGQRGGGTNYAANSSHRKRASNR
jgi:glycosyltransferase involved in cell wall biosynthesis